MLSQCNTTYYHDREFVQYEMSSVVQCCKYMPPVNFSPFIYYRKFVECGVCRQYIAIYFGRTYWESVECGVRSSWPLTIRESFRSAARWTACEHCVNFNSSKERLHIQLSWCRRILWHSFCTFWNTLHSSFVAVKCLLNFSLCFDHFHKSVSCWGQNNLDKEVLICT